VGAEASDADWILVREFFLQNKIKTQEKHIIYKKKRKVPLENNLKKKGGGEKLTYLGT
jgi:hypothetical protein